jgi:hypothetical protein
LFEAPIKAIPDITNSRTQTETPLLGNLGRGYMRATPKQAGLRDVWQREMKMGTGSPPWGDDMERALGAQDRVLRSRLKAPSIAKKEPGLDFDYEGVVQLGTFGSDDVRAWTVATDTGYTLTSLPLRPRFSVKADISSGDNPHGHTLGTFYPVFPLGNYLFDGSRAGSQEPDGNYQELLWRSNRPSCRAASRCT